MYTRNCFALENKKEGSPISTIYRIKKRIDLFFHMETDINTKIAIIKWLDQNFERHYVKSVGITYKADIKNIVYRLGLNYLSRSVFEDLGITTAEMEEHGILPKTLANSCFDLIENKLLSNFSFWSKTKINQLPIELRTRRAILDPKSQYECEISQDLYRKAYC